MLKIGVVGDVSQGDTGLFAKALDAALAASDVVVQVGDINPGYDVLKARMGTGKLFPVPGNHDILGPGSWDASLPGLPKQWRKDFPEAVLIGLDNSLNSFGPGWDILSEYEKAPTQVPLFLFMHKALSPLVLPDGTESDHVMMGETTADAEAKKMMDWMSAHASPTVCCGHYHGSSSMRTSYGQVILEGRGGASGYHGTAVCGYTLIYVQSDGWTAHAVDLT